jgi:hypothetical protein
VSDSITGGSVGAGREQPVTITAKMRIILTILDFISFLRSSLNGLIKGVQCFTNTIMHVKLTFVLTLSGRAFFGVVWFDIVVEVDA